MASVRRLPPLSQVAPIAGLLLLLVIGALSAAFAQPPLALASAALAAHQPPAQPPAPDAGQAAQPLTQPHSQPAGQVVDQPGVTDNFQEEVFAAVVRLPAPHAIWTRPIPDAGRPAGLASVGRTDTFTA